MSTVSCPPPEQRRLYTLKWSGEGGVELHCWSCPVCDFVARDRDELEARRQMLAHDCDAGWCAVAALVLKPEQHVQLPRSVHVPYVSPARLKRYGAPQR